MPYLNLLAAVVAGALIYSLAHILITGGLWL